MTLLRRPIAAKAPQLRRSVGSRPPVMRSTAVRNTEPSSTRTATMVNGGSAVTATALKKNEPPQSSDRKSSSPHSVGVMVRLTIAGILEGSLLGLRAIP